MIGERRTRASPTPSGCRPSTWLTFEVTNGEFRRFLADPEGYDDRASWTEAGWRWKQTGVSQATARLRTDDPRFPRFGRDGLPVMLVTWYEANAYCRWLTRRLGGGRWLFRLPDRGRVGEGGARPGRLRLRPGHGAVRAAGRALQLAEEPRRGGDPRRPRDEPAGLSPEPLRRLPRLRQRPRMDPVGLPAATTQTQPYRDDDRNADDAPGLRVTRGGSWYSASAVRLQLAYREEFQPELSSDDLGFRVAALLGAGEMTAVIGAPTERAHAAVRPFRPVREARA